MTVLHLSLTGEVKRRGRAEIKKRALSPPLLSRDQIGPRRSVTLRPSLQNYFFVAFFAFLAFFAVFFFAFLAIASSFGLMEGNATPRPARGGLASQQPQLISEQIRSALSAPS